MNEERQMILRMLKEGKISVEEVDALLRALEEEDGETARSEPVGETRPGDAHSFAEFGAELGSTIREIVNTIPREVLREVRKEAKEWTKPKFFSVLHSLHDLVEGAAEETVSGNIELSIPSGARASIDAAVRTGRISSTLPLSQVTSDRRSLRGILNEPGAKVALRTVSGNIGIDGHET